MQILYHALILFLLLTLVAGLWRIRRGPTAADRMLAAQLFGTTATAILLLLAEASALPALRDVALVLALLAAITVTAFTRRVRIAVAPQMQAGDLGGNPGITGEAVATEVAEVTTGALAEGEPVGGSVDGAADGSAEDPAGDRHAR